MAFIVAAGTCIYDFLSPPVLLFSVRPQCMHQRALVQCRSRRCAHPPSPFVSHKITIHLSTHSCSECATGTWGAHQRMCVFGTHSHFALHMSVPLLSPLVVVPSGSWRLLWQHVHGAATADVRHPARSDNCSVASPFPSTSSCQPCMSRLAPRLCLSALCYCHTAFGTLPYKLNCAVFIRF